MAFISGPDGDLKTAFVSDAFLLDQFVGNTLFCSGRNLEGQLGDNTAVSKSNPIQTVTGGINWKQIACGDYHTAAIKTDGTLWTWGSNATYGQLGDSTTANKSSPIQTIAFGTNWKSVACGYYHTAAIKTDGTLWIWGNNVQGGVGDNTTANKSSPVQTVAFGTNWKQAAGGRYHTAAIKTDGTLWTWGGNAYGQLGDNTIVYKSSPVQTVALGTNWKQLACGNTYVVAIKTDGTLWGWGRNDFGQLGDNTNGFSSNKSSPVQTITYDTKWKMVSVGNGYAHTAAVKSDGTLWCWGYNVNGQLGDNSITPRSSPVQTVTFGTNWKQVDCGYYSTTAIKNDGTLWIWGRNSSGQLGDNTIVYKSSPVQTTAYGTSWKQVACGRYHTAAVTNGDI